MTTASDVHRPGLWLRILRWPVRPDGSLDEAEQHNARLLLGLELVVIAGLVANLIFAPDSEGMIPALALMVAAYALTRATRYYRIGGGLALGVMSAGVLTFYNPAYGGSFDYVTNVLTWTALPVVLASMIFSVQGVLIVAAANLGVIVLAGLVWPGQNPGLTLSASGFSLTVFPLMIVAVSHRNQLEKFRQAELQAAFDALYQSDAELERRVIERTAELARARDDAEEARRRAEQADQVKSQFLASMSHELRTPLNAVLNFTEMMAQGMVGDVTPRQKDVLDRSLRSSLQLLDLINDVLDISKITAGMLSLFIEDQVDIDDELAAVITAAGTLIHSDAVRLVVDIERPLPLMRCDRRRVRQILLNLVSNAAKFTEAGTITLRARRRGDDILFAVIDTGRGIPQDQQEQIFLPFVQTEQGIRQATGTGLGLAISKFLAEAHGGRLWVESQPGQGAAFYVSLPVEAAPGTAARPAERGAVAAHAD